MSYNPFKIVTGYVGQPHVTAQQLRFINQGSFGNACVILPTGNRFNLEIATATQLNLYDGSVSMQGCVGIIDAGTVKTIEVEAGSTGMKRIDYVCVKYEKDSGTGVESMDIVVKTGTPVAGTPSPPLYTDGLIEAGDTLVEAPIWAIYIDGLSIATVERVARVTNTQPDLEALLSGYIDLLDRKATVYTFTTGESVNNARTGMDTREVFLFNGSGVFSQEVLGLNTQTNAFGVGYKNSSTSVALLTVCGGKLYYSTYTNTGAGTVFNPLNLQSNA